MKKTILLFIILASTLSFAQSNVAHSPITVKTPVNPVFTGIERNFIKTISQPANGTKADKIIEIGIEAGNSFTKKSIFSVQAYSSNSKADSLLCTSGKFNGNTIRLKLKDYSSPIKISVALNEGASINSLLKLRVAYVKTGGKTVRPEKEYSYYRIGRIVRKPGDDDVKCFRIPGLVSSNRGTLLAVYDIRHNNCRDLPGNIDVGLSRSTDGGETWLPMQKIIDMGQPEDLNGAGDPSILVDRKTGTIWVAALWSHGNRAWNGSKKGLSPDETGQLVLVNSTDDGITWSKPVSITKDTKNPDWNLFFQGPGNGISLTDGTLVFPAQFKDSSNIPYSTIIYSKDGGKSWKVGTGAKENTTEAQVVQLQNGDLMLNMRDNRGGFRSVAVTADLGKIWKEDNSSRSALIEPVCMASFIRVFTEIPAKRNSLLAFSNPASKMNRDSITVKFSIDEGKRWNKIAPVLIDERECFGYSCLTKIDDKTLGLLYEGNGEIYFVKVKLPGQIFKLDFNDFDGGSIEIRKKN